MQLRCVIAAILLAAVVGCGGKAGKTTGPSRSAAYQRGHAAAEQAISQGVLKIKEYPPLPSPKANAEHVNRLKQAGIDYEACQCPPGTPESEFSEEVQGWNERMSEEIRRRQIKGAGKS